MGTAPRISAAWCRALKKILLYVTGRVHVIDRDKRASAMITHYDPHQPPEPDEWNALDEPVQIDMVVEYHEREGFELPNEYVHAIIHIVVENQAAMGDMTPVAATLERLMDEGLDRHDAIHAVGTAITEHLWSRSHGQPNNANDYFELLHALDAQKWLDSWEE